MLAQSTISQKSRRQLGCYFTRNSVSHLLAEQLGNLKPRTVLDLACGDGTLASAVVKRWGNIDLITVDIDPRHLTSSLMSSHAFLRHEHLVVDALSDKLKSLVSGRVIDAAVCNPPFVTPRWRRDFARIIDESGLSDAASLLGTIDAPTVFLAQLIRLTAPGATIGVILPDTHISGKRHRRLREHLLARHRIEHVMTLPPGSFHGTAAQASIVILAKDAWSKGPIRLSQLNRRGEVTGTVLVPPDAAAERLDFAFHAKNQCIDRRTTQRSLGGSAITVFRGKFSSAAARSSHYPVVHLTEINDRMRGKWVDLSDFSAPADFGSEHEFAVSGDILVARIGRNLERKVIGIGCGRVLISDCIYAIRAPESLRGDLLEALSSKHGESWIRSRAYGVGAKQLAKADLLSFEF